MKIMSSILSIFECRVVRERHSYRYDCVKTGHFIFRRTFSKTVSKTERLLMCPELGPERYNRI